MRKLTLLIALLLVAGLALVACGGTTAEQVAEEAAEVVGEEVVATAEAVVEEVAPTVEAAAEEVMAEPTEEMMVTRPTPTSIWSWKSSRTKSPTTPWPP